MPSIVKTLWIANRVLKGFGKVQSVKILGGVIGAVERAFGQPHCVGGFGGKLGAVVKGRFVAKSFV